jgi:hypothetical protein
VVTLVVPISTTPPPESTLALLTIPTVQLHTAAPQLGIVFLFEQQQAYQEEQQAQARAQPMDAEHRAAQ